MLDGENRAVGVLYVLFIERVPTPADDGQGSTGIEIEGGKREGFDSLDWIGDDVVDYINELKHARGFSTSTWSELATLPMSTQRKEKNLFFFFLAKTA